ncbi:MAG: hypothetical protein ACP5H5_02330 [Pyrobaculum sp.]
MRGQLILLTAVAIALAVAIVVVAQWAVQAGQMAASARTGYGIYGKAWPEVVDLADSHTLQASLKGASQISAGAFSAGLYANPPYAYKWLTYNYTYLYLNKSAAVVKEGFLPLGAQLGIFANVWYYGFNGSIGPYPYAAVLSSKWNVDPFRQDLMAIPGATLYRIVAVWQAQDYNGYYVLSYGGHVSEPGSPGETYHVALSELLMYLRMYDPQRSLFVFLVDNETCSVWQLPWWAEISKCPLCLLHVRVPRYDEIGAPYIFQRGRAMELLVVLLPNYQGNAIPVLKSGRCSQAGGVQTDYVAINFNVNNNPKATFSQSVVYSGPTPVSYGGSLYWGAQDIVTWQEATANTQVCGYRNPVSGGVASRGKSVVADPGFGQVAEVYAVYQAGTRNWAYNVYYGPLYLPSNWPGFIAEALVRPNPDNYQAIIRPARFDLYYYSYDPSNRHPMCAGYVGVQAVSPVLVWALWRGYGAGGVWNGRTWDDGGTVYFSNSWYLFTIAMTPNFVRYRVYSYNTTRPILTLSTKSWIGAPWTSWRFYIVLGSAIVDNPASTSSTWVEKARYAYVRVRPWADPPPSIMFVSMSGPPMVRPARVDVVAGREAYALSNVTVRGAIGLVGVEDLIIKRSTSLNVSVADFQVVRVDPNQQTYRYVLDVRSSVQRGSLAAAFTLFYSLGGSYVNTTCPSALCSVRLLQYYGYVGRVDRAVYELYVTTPSWVSHAVIVNVYGARVAVSAGQPRIYAIRSDKTYYLINEGSGTAVFVVPWLSTGPLITSVSPDDTRFAARFDVTDRRRSWTVLLVPPGSVVRVDLADYADLRTYLVPWQARIPNVWTDVYPPCTTPSYVRVYFPGNVTLLRYFVMLNRTWASPPAAYAFLYGGWRSVPVYLDPNGRLWLKFTVNPGEQLTGKGVIVALCGAGVSTAPSSFFDVYLSGSGSVSLTASLSNYPDGFTAAVWSGSGVSVALYNSTLSWTCSPTRAMVGIQYTGSTPIWHYDGFCFDMHIWEQYGTGSANTYMISVSRGLVLYQIATNGRWWLRSYPNSAPALRGRPMTAFTTLYASAPFSAALIPFTWPRPYYYLDFINPGVVYRTT